MITISLQNVGTGHALSLRSVDAFGADNTFSKKNKKTSSEPQTPYVYLSNASFFS